jgi:trk system potassium uptake protein TrkH
MNSRIIANLGFLLQFAGTLTILPIIVGMYLAESQALGPLLLTSLSFLIVGFLFNALCERKELDFKSSCALVLLAFLLMPLIGSMQYIFSDPFKSPNLVERFTNSYFESVSGFTTTGFSFIPNIDALPRSYLLYRSMTELMGGIGVVFLLLAFFHSRKSLNNLANGLGMESISDNLKKVFYSVFCVYGACIAIFTAIFYFLGFRDLIRTGYFVIDTITGGYSPTTDGFQIYLTVPTIACVTALMLVGSVNFSFNYQLFSLKLKKMFSKEVLLYILIVLLGTGTISALTGKGPLDSLFHVVSMTSSTGYDYIGISSFNDTVRSVFLLLMILGGCSFSMAGGIKISRILSFMRSVRRSIGGIVSQSGLIQEESEGAETRDFENLSASVAILLFVATLITFSVLLSTMGISLTTALFEVGSALTTNGFSTGATNVLMPTAYKWLLTAAMIIGRVELATVLIALTPSRRKE